MNSTIVELDRRLASREANHRFLNTLTALQGLLRADFDDFADLAVREAVTTFSSRIQAFASLLRTLGDGAGDGAADGAGDDTGAMDASAYLERLCQELCRAHLAPRGLSCAFRSDPAILPREACQNLGLIVVELVTNAAKHAFPGRAAGRVSVSLQQVAAGWICRVADNGCGFRGDHQGDGLKLVRGLAAALDGELQIHSGPGGAAVTLRLPDAAPHLGSPGLPRRRADIRQ
jgi:two-component sensor histidine kinase